MNVDYNKLKIVSSNGTHIDNIKEFVEYLYTFDTLPDDLITYLNYVLSQLDKFNLDNKEELVGIINQKLNDNKDNKISDKEALSEMTSLSPEFNRLQIVNISKEYTDSKRDVEYITFEHENGETEVLFVQYQNKLEDYINQNRDRLDSITPEEVFDYLKNNVNRNLEFNTLEEIEKHPDLVKNAIVKDEDTLIQEEREVTKYMSDHNIDTDMTISVDYFGERLYKADDYICKFAYIRGERKMQVIKETDMKLDIKNDEETKEEDLKEDVVEEVSINDDISFDESIDNKQNAELDSVTYEELPIVPIDEENYSFVVGLLDRKELEGYILTAEEDLFVKSYMKSMIVAMADKDQSETLTNDEIILLENYIASNNKDVSNDNDLNVEVSNEDVKEDAIVSKIAEEYLVSKESLEKSKHEQKKLILENDGRLGAANTVIVLELAIITMYILGFIYYIK